MGPVGTRFVERESTFAYFMRPGPTSKPVVTLSPSIAIAWVFCVNQTDAIGRDGKDHL
jgi:hypothetical protein